MARFYFGLRKFACQLSATRKPAAKFRLATLVRLVEPQVSLQSIKVELPDRPVALIDNNDNDNENDNNNDNDSI